MNEATRSLLESYLASRDLSPHSRRAIRSDLAKFVRWFEAANQEPFDVTRVTVQDLADFRDHLAHVRHQAVATVNRGLVSIRGFLGHLVQSGSLPGNPGQAVKELKRMPSVPKGLSVAETRKVLREVELRGDRRAKAVLSLMLFAGLRVSDVVGLELSDLEIQERSGRVICRRGKGNKQRMVPLSLQARRAVAEYLQTRPPLDSNSVFIGERGPLTANGIRAICLRFSAICGITFTPHTLRHTFAHRYLQQSGNDLVGLAQVLGHENLNTTSIYTKKRQEELQQAVEAMGYS
jgi:integrase/recombinase XerC